MTYPPFFRSRHPVQPSRCPERIFDFDVKEGWIICGTINCRKLETLFQKGGNHEPMEVLMKDEANTTAYGNPEITELRVSGSQTNSMSSIP